MNRREFLGLLAGSFAAAPVLGFKDMIPLGITSRGVRPVGDFPAAKVRWGKVLPSPYPEYVYIGKAFVDVEHDCACGWTAGGMYACYTVKEGDIKSRQHLLEVLEVKKKNALLMLEDIWNTAKDEPFLRHGSCPKIVGAYRPPVDNDVD